MSELSFIANTGIQYYRLRDVVVDLSAGNLVSAIRFSEMSFRQKIYLEPVMYLASMDKYIRNKDLRTAGFLDPQTGKLLVEESQLNPNLQYLDVDDLLSVGRIDIPVGPQRKSGLEILENRWLPIPMFQQDIYGHGKGPHDWCRIRLVPVKEGTTNKKKMYDIILAVDTREDPDGQMGARISGAEFETYAFAGYSRTTIEANEHPRRIKEIDSLEIPSAVYSFCSVNPWLDMYLKNIFGCEDLNKEEPGRRMKYLVYYMYFLCYFHKLGVIPDIKLYSDSAGVPIPTTLILDIGNSRTFGIVAEEPLNMSFSKSSKLQLTDLETGDVYDDSFDMRLCFKEERFGIRNPDGQFSWPSILRLGKEAARTIAEDDSLSGVTGGNFNSHYSSPKRYLWDKEPSVTPWRFISQSKLQYAPVNSVYFRGISEQFTDDGTFTQVAPLMANASNYSRSSLMTFCFVEILLQARMQINSFEFREHNDFVERRREIVRVILTCPTAMPRQEQITLRKCMQDASIVLDRYYSGTYDENKEADTLQGKKPVLTESKIEVIPSIRDLKMNPDNADLKKTWNFDEATCCQMVYMYSELRRYCGNVREFFSLYGRRRNEEERPSLTVASLDIGAGTSDIMICNYKDLGESVSPDPLFWDSFHIAGDDLVKLIIKDVLLEPMAGFDESGLISRKIRSEGKRPVPETMYGFFGDIQTMGIAEQRRRREFTAQVLIPTANKLLSVLKNLEEDRASARREHRALPTPPSYLSYEEVFPEHRPSPSLMDAFEAHFGFRYEDLQIPFSEAFMNDIIRRQFEPHLKKWSAMFSAYGCDIVLIGGRPCSLDMMYGMMRRFYPVSPNRLISLNKYRVGSWYLGSSETGFSEDKKSMVAVGALISYLAETGRLNVFKLTAEQLKKKVLPTSEFFGIVGRYGFDKPFITPDTNVADVPISALPVVIGCKQLNVQAYSTQMMYILDFDEAALRKQAAGDICKARHLPPDTPESELDASAVVHQMGVIRQRIKSRVPLVFQLEREYHTDKEAIKIMGVDDAERNAVSRQFFKFRPQSWSEDESNWLDSGVFVLHINN